MSRVKFEALSLVAEKYLYENALFSGIGYDIQTNGRVKSIEIIDGCIKGKYISPFFNAIDSPIEIDISGFTEDDVEGYGDIDNEIGLSCVCVDMRFQLLLNKTAYTGLALVFHNVFCVRELGYRNGFLFNDAEWDQSGLLQNLSIEDDFDQHYSWHSNGALKSGQISISETLGDFRERIYRLRGADGMRCKARRVPCGRGHTSEK